MIEIKSKNSKGLRSFAGWLRELGRSEVTGWRWRKKRWIEVVNIAGRLYISNEEIEKFHSRAMAGEFATERRPFDSQNAPRS